ncbi:hypothetical protein [Paenibacillus sp. 1-18]|uniref:hypothetical protein n=1 Tax=Paenibacillus sp. 1-18 TaxID=1333846 RepID=UPI0012DF7888|nr:hypothetical protein [Paenibacillus sp. 1-18]
MSNRGCFICLDCIKGLKSPAPKASVTESFITPSSSQKVYAEILEISQGRVSQLKRKL